MKVINLLLSFALISLSLSAADPNFHVYLAFGQSNMDGAGQIEAQDKNCPERFKMMAAVNMPNAGRTKGNWYTANPPLCRQSSQLSPCDYFGRKMVEKLPETIKVGIINVAVAGCSIDLFDEDKCASYLSTAADWLKNMAKEYDNNPFRVLVNMAKKAQNDGVIKGILLHQGETNTGDQKWPGNVKTIYDRMLKELGLKAEDVPLLIGEVVSAGSGGRCASHNQVIANTPKTIPTAHVVSSEGIPAQGDGLHFTSAGYRTFGARYAEVMLGLLKQ